VKTDSLALIKRPQGAGIGPVAVSRLGPLHQDISFQVGHDLTCGLPANPVQKSARVSHARHVHWGFVHRFPWGTTLSNWAVEAVQLDAMISGPDTSPGAGSAPLPAYAKGNSAEGPLVKSIASTSDQAEANGRQLRRRSSDRETG
jgi:hypothetical protein